MARRWPDDEPPDGSPEPTPKRRTVVNAPLQLSEELSAGPARLRVDVHGAEPLEHVLDDMSFLNYRLADVRISPEVSLAEPDIVWHRDAAKGIAYDGRRMTFSGPWPAGPIQKVIVTMLALRMEVGRAPSRSMPRPSATATRRCCSSAASRTTASRWARSRPAGAARCSSRRRRPSSTRPAARSIGLEGSRSSRSGPRAPSAPTRPRRSAGVEKFFGDDADLGDLLRAEQRRRRHRARHRRQLRRRRAPR